MEESQPRKAQAVNFRENVRILFSNHYWKIYFWFHLFENFVSGTLYAIMGYYCKYVLMDPDYAGMIFGITAVMQFAGQMADLPLFRRFENISVGRFGLLLSTAGGALGLFSIYGNVTVFMITIGMRYFGIGMIIPMVSSFVSWLFLRRFDLNGRKLREMQKEVQERNLQRSAQNDSQS